MNIKGVPREAESEGSCKQNADLTNRKRIRGRRVNDEKGAVACPWNRKFLGYSVTIDKKTKLKVSSKAVERLKDKLKKKFQEGRGRSEVTFIIKLKPILVDGAITLSWQKRIFEEFDVWIRLRLRGIIWRQKERRKARFKMLMTRGVHKERTGDLARMGGGLGGSLQIPI